MPWSKANLPSHVQTLGDKQQRQWMNVANGCLQDGKEEGTCIRMANGVVKKEFDALVDGVGEGLLKAEQLGDVSKTILEFDSGLLSDDVIAEAAKSWQYVDSYEYESRQLSQEDAAYSPTGGTAEKACSNCFFFVSPARCTVVRGIIAPNGLSNQWRAVPVYDQTPMPVTIVKESNGTWETVAATGAFAPARHPSLYERAKALLGVKQRKETTGIKVFKQADGSLRWFARYSNSWEDRDKEIITQEAHKEFVEWATKNNAYPELWLWHTAGTRFGQADWLDFSDGFAFASGTIDDTPQAKAAVEYLSNQKDFGVSHGFFSVQKGKEIVKYRSFEVSVLPRSRAAVWTTDFNVIGKETEMGFTQEKRATLVGAFGEEFVKSLETDAEQSARQLKELGIEFKAVEQPADPPPASTPAPAADVPAAATAAVHDAQTKAIGSVLQDVTAALKDLSGVVQKQATELAELKKSDDEKVANHFLAAAQKAAGAGRPTQSDGTVIDEKSAAAAGAPKAPAPNSEEAAWGSIMGLIGATAQASAAVPAQVPSVQFPPAQ